MVAAAGLGRRLGDQGPKALVPLAGRPLLAYALADVEGSRCTSAVVVVTHPSALQAVEKLVGEEGFSKVTQVVPGGPTRQASVAAGLAALPSRLEHVAVHDAARPLAGPHLLDRLLELLVHGPKGLGGVIPGTPVTDTIRRVDRYGRSRGVIDREELRAVQTPQLFPRPVLEEAHQRARRDGVEATDDAALVERIGFPVLVVPSAVENIKVTTHFDLAVAAELLARRARGPGARPEP